MVNFAFTPFGSLSALDMVAIGPQLPLFFNSGTGALVQSNEAVISISPSNPSVFQGQSSVQAIFTGSNLSTTLVNGKTVFDGGTVSRFQIEIDGATVIDISGASFSFQQFGTLLSSASPNILDFILSAGDSVNGAGGNDVLAGYSGDDALNGANGNDTLFGGDGNDTLNGGSGNDVFFGGAGSDSLNGDAGIDTVDYSDAPSAVKVSLAAPGSNTGVAAGDIFNSIEVVVGTNFDDELIGDGGNNRLEGGSGQDLLEGGAGADSIVGGDGADAASYALSNAGVTVNLATMTGTGGDAEGDTLTEIEDLVGSSFDDVLLGASGANNLQGREGSDVLVGESYGTTGYDEASGKVVRLYQATLDRLPDEGGHATWTNALLNGASLQQIASGFVGSSEFQNQYGGLSNADFVELLYNNVLDRPSDPGGAAGWINALNTGTSREGVVLGFSESLEFKNKMFPRELEFSRAELEASWTDDVFRVYQATLDRAPDLEGFKGWVAALADGMDYLTVVDGFVGSSEFQNQYGGLSDADFVELLYSNVLDRPSDPGGAAGWINALNTGTSRAQVVEGFAQSDEFKNKTAQPLEDWMESPGLDDVLDGGAGDDVLFGGLLADEFQFKFSDGGQDRIVGFEAWDTIQLEGFGFANSEAAASAFVQDGSDALYQYGNGEIRLVDFNIADLTSDEFQIV